MPAIELLVTVAFKSPAAVGGVVKVTTSAVRVAEVTVPAAPLVNTTLLLAAVGEKPKPLIVIEVALARG